MKSHYPRGAIYIDYRFDIQTFSKTRAESVVPPKRQRRSPSAVNKKTDAVIAVVGVNFAHIALSEKDNKDDIPDKIDAVMESQVDFSVYGSRAAVDDFRHLGL